MRTVSVFKLFLILLMVCINVLYSEAQMTPRMPTMPSPPRIKPQNPFPNRFHNYNNYNFKLPSKPKYEVQKGEVLFISGSKMAGDFKIKKNSIWFKNIENGKKYDIKPFLFHKIILKGTSSKIMYRKDSTEIFYLEPFKNFFRKIADSKYEAFDNSFIIDENTNLPIDYYRIIKKWDSTFIKIVSFVDYSNFLGSKEYFTKTEEILSQSDGGNKNEVILDDWFNLIYTDNIPIKLGWKAVTVFLKTGEVVEGIGMIQPFTYAATYSDINKSAFVHVYKNANFYIYKNSEVDSFVLNKRTYTPQYLKKFNRYYFATSWDYKGKKYFVTRIYDSLNKQYLNPFDLSMPEKENYIFKRSYFIYNKSNEGYECLFLEVNGNKIKKAEKQDELYFEFNLK